MSIRHKKPARARIAAVLGTCLAGVALTVAATWLALAALVWIFLQPILFLLFALAHAT